MAASANTVRLLIRRPHAYRFRANHPNAPIPGVVLLEVDGKVVGTADLASDRALEDLLALLAK